MKRSVFLYILIFITLFSCNKKNEVVDILIKDNKTTQWSLKAIENDTIIFLNSHFIFSSKKSYEYYFAFGDQERGVVKDYNKGGKDYRKWKFDLNDSILALNDFDPNCSYKVIKYNNDTIWMIGNGYEGAFELVRIKNPWREIPNRKFRW